ncbi:MAG: hypothetical protein RLZZ407_1443 [Pseudomonadota bacterium]|jgi:hypothetical protein
MMARRGFFGVVVGGAMALLGACGVSGGDTYRFKMTLEVDTPEGVKSGSSVYEVEAKNVAALTPGGVGLLVNVRGEAISVDLPEGRTVFALLKTVNAKGHDDLAYTSMVALDPLFRWDYVESAARIATGVGLTSPAEVLPENRPMLVTFKDIADPTSVVLVDPDDLAASFGAGYRLKAITVQVTDKPVTVGIEKRLDNNFWSTWGKIRQQELPRPGGVMANPYFKTLQGRLSRNDFTTENSK